jgi:DNA-binding transcriptional LysR family regulator
MVNSMPPARLNQLKVRQLKFIELLATLGSLAATAEHLSMTPSAASMMLKEIEAIFNAKLFERRGRGMALTAQGQMLLPRCKTVLGEIGAMGSSMRGSSSPLLRIGAFPHTTTTVLPEIVKILTTGPFAWRIQIIDQSAEQLFERLLRSEIDLFLGRLPSKDLDVSRIGDVSQRVLYPSDLSVVVRAKHPLATRKKLDLQELLAHQWVLPSTESTTRLAIMDAFLKQGLAPPEPVVESPSFHYSLSLVANTDFLTCCAKSAAQADQHRTVALPIQLSTESSPVSLVWRKASQEALRALTRLEPFLKGFSTRQ